MARNGPGSYRPTAAPAGVAVGHARAPTPGEIAMCRDVFGDAVDGSQVAVDGGADLRRHALALDVLELAPGGHLAGGKETREFIPRSPASLLR